MGHQSAVGASAGVVGVAVSSTLGRAYPALKPRAADPSPPPALASLYTVVVVVVVASRLDQGTACGHYGLVELGVPSPAVIEEGAGEGADGADVDADID